MKAGRAFIIILALAMAEVTGRGAVHASYGHSAPSTTWTQQAQLHDPPPQSFDLFGYAAVVSGDTALVGAPARNTGVVYVFARRGTAWSQQAALTASDGGGCFGNSVALVGDTALIGAPCANNGAGAAYVFIHKGTTWTQDAELGDPAPVTSSDTFGVSVALSGDTALIGAFGKNNYAGAAYVFVRQGGIWHKQAELDDPAPAASTDLFGSSVALSGDTALLTTPHKNNNAGAAYVYVRAGPIWSQQATLSASDANGTFGWSSGSVALDGDTALVGAWAGGTGKGAAYVFVRRGATWTEQNELTASDGAPGDEFGWSGALHENTALVGAAYAKSGAGATYEFIHVGTAWTQVAELGDPAPVVSSDSFGCAVSLDGDSALIGADGKNNYAGAAYVFAHS